MLYPFPVSPPETPYSILPPPASIRVLFLHSSFCSLIHLHWGIDPSQDQGPFLPLMSNKSIHCYICSWGQGSIHMYSLVGSLVPGSSGVSGWLIFFFYLWVTNPFSSFSSFSNASIGVQWLAVNIHLCICQAVAEPLRRQLYDAPVSKHFLASTSVSGFAVCVWDGTPWWGSLWMVSASQFVSIFFHENFVSTSKKDQSTHTLVFILLELHVVCELYLGYSELLG